MIGTTIFIASSSIAVVGLSVLFGYILGIDAQYKADKEKTEQDTNEMLKVLNKDGKKMELKEDIKRQIDWKREDINRIQKKLNTYQSTLDNLDKSKKETSKYLKENIESYNNILKHYCKEMVVLEAIYNE